MKKCILIILLFLVLLKVSAQEVSYSIVPICSNENIDIFGPRIFDKSLYVVSNDNENIEEKLDENEYNSLSELYVLEDCQLKPAYLYSATYKEKLPISSTINDGPISGNSDNSLIFFSNNGDEKVGYQMGIFYLTKTDSGWSDAYRFPYNSEKYSCMHPFLDEENKRILFSSNMPDGKSKFNLYEVAFDGKKFGELIKINKLASDANYIFPASYNNKIYFTSDREGGFGGLDIYFLHNDSIHIMPPPINSEFDDLSYYLINDKNGLFTSNRNSNGKFDASYLIRIKSNQEEAPIIDQIASSSVEVIENLSSYDELFKKISSNQTSNQTTYSNFNFENPAKNMMDSISISYNQIQSNQAKINPLLTSFLISTEDSIFNDASLKLENKIALESDLEAFLNSLKQYENISEIDQLFNQLVETINSLEEDSKKNVLLSQIAGIKKLLFGIEEEKNNISNMNNKLQELSIMALRQEAAVSGQSLNELSEINKDVLSKIGINEKELTSKEITTFQMSEFLDLEKFQSILFPLNSFYIRKMYKDTLDQLIITFKTIDNSSILIEGHTDITGTNDYNLYLSNLRVNAVEKYLLEKGVETNKIVKKHFGPNVPRYDNATRDGRIKNRRVEIKFIH